jgi:hypothetical protein
MTSVLFYVTSGTTNPLPLFFVIMNECTIGLANDALRKKQSKSMHNASSMGLVARSGSPTYVYSSSLSPFPPKPGRFLYQGPPSSPPPRTFPPFRYLPSTLTPSHLPIASFFLLSLLSCLHFSCVCVRPGFYAVSIRDSGELQPSCFPSRHICSSSRTPTVPSRSRLQILLSLFVFPALALPVSLVLERVC